jgi:D-alanine transaminase
MQDIAYVKGRFGPLSEAVVSIEDRGFQFADGVYEVLVAPGGRPFRLPQHLARLKRSTDGIDLMIDYESLGLPGIISEGIARCGHKDVMVYIQITRGVAPRNHVYGDNLTPTVVATFKARPVYSEEMRRKGVSLETVRDIRWARCSVKSTALLPNVLLKNAAQQAGYFDALIVGPDEDVRETTLANVFMVTQGVLVTPPATDKILHGVTRDYVLECASELGIESEESEFTVDELKAADEAFVSSTTMDVMAVTSIDGEPIGEGDPGPLTQRLFECFRSGMRVEA